MHDFINANKTRYGNCDEMMLHHMIFMHVEIQMMVVHIALFMYSHALSTVT